MANITTRTGKGSALTHAEMDANFNNLNDGKVEKVSSTDNAIARFDGITGDLQDSGVVIDDSNNIVAGGNTVWHAGNDGEGSGLDADLLDGKHASEFASLSDLDAGSSLAQNGYQRLSSGLIIQWGYIADTSSTMTITYPITFPNKVFSFGSQMVKNTQNYQNITVNSSYATSLSSVTVYWDSGADGILWMAIGY
jgi:hypothetical protein